MKKNVLLGMIIVMTMLLVCACTVDEPCAYCNRKPSVEYELSDGSTIYVCEKCSSKCMQCGADAITHYENLPDIVFVCDACEAEYEIKQIDNVTAELENTMDEVGKSFTGNGDKTETQKEVEQEEIEKLTDGYYILEVFEDKIENKTDKIWVFARDTRKEFETTDYYMLIDLENNIYAKIEAKDEMRWINNIEDKAIIVYNSDVDKYYILDTQGKNLEYKYCNNDDEKIVFIAEKVKNRLFGLKWRSQLLISMMYI